MKNNLKRIWKFISSSLFSVKQIRPNGVVWILVCAIVLMTITISFSDRKIFSQQPNPMNPVKNRQVYENEYPIADYNEPEPNDLHERKVKQKKNQRYDKKRVVLRNTNPRVASVVSTDGEPIPPAIPFFESNLIVVGEITNKKGSLSNNKKGIYSESSLLVRDIIKQDNNRILKPGNSLSFDRGGGIVQYPNGQRILYREDWQNWVKMNETYVVFLSNDDYQNPNYKLITGYLIKNNIVFALDSHPDFHRFSGMNSTEFVNIILNQSTSRTNN